MNEFFHFLKYIHAHPLFPYPLFSGNFTSHFIMVIFGQYLSPLNKGDDTVNVLLSKRVRQYNQPKKIITQIDRAHGLRQDQKACICEHRKIFKVCLAILQHYA